MWRNFLPSECAFQKAVLTVKNANMSMDRTAKIQNLSNGMEAKKFQNLSMNIAAMHLNPKNEML